MGNKTKHDKFTAAVMRDAKKVRGNTIPSAGEDKKPRKVGVKRKSIALTKPEQTFVRILGMTDNASEAVRQAYPIETAKMTKASIHVKASKLLSSDKIKSELALQQQKMDLLAGKAVDKIRQALDSEDEDLSFKASKYVYDQAHGQATKKVEKTVRTVEVKLDLTGVRIGAHYLTTPIEHDSTSQ